MEIRRFSASLAFLLVAVVSQCSEARHSLTRRETKFDNYDDPFLSDGATDTEQNDADNAGEDEEGPAPNATIVSRPQTYNMTIGRSVRLECHIDIKDVVVDWTKDGENIVVNNYLVASPDRYKFNSTAGSELIINSVELNDSGIYRCRVNQDLLMQIDHRLVVSESPSVIDIKASDNGRPHEGADLLLTCDVTGSPAPEITWSVADSTGTGNRKLTEKDGEFSRNSVFIKNVKRENSGKYYCYAFNSAGNAQKGIVVSVLGKPRIHVHKTVVNSAINVEATLECAVHEETPVTITWLKNDKPITSASNIIITTMGTHSNLTVVPQTDADFGTYTCQADCEFVGKHSRSIQLVQRPVVEELAAEGPKLSWRVRSHQKLEEIQVQLIPLSEDTEWKPIRVPLPETQTHEYDLSYMMDEADLKPGRYEAIVKVKNTQGWSEEADTTLINIVDHQPIIQGASVYRGNDAYANRPATVLLSTILMYLLVRML